MEVAGLLDLQLVDVTAQAHELPGQLLVLKPHLRLQGRRGRRQRRAGPGRGVGGRCFSSIVPVPPRPVKRRPNEGLASPFGVHLERVAHSQLREVKRLREWDDK